MPLSTQLVFFSSGLNESCNYSKITGTSILLCSVNESILFKDHDKIIHHAK